MRKYFNILNKIYWFSGNVRINKLISIKVYLYIHIISTCFIVFAFDDFKI